jgi:outer membrane protein OmpA-like peptidoglycan-associated protein
VAEVLLTNRERNLTVEGHTDSQGSKSYNMDLSQRRADAVRRYLIQRDYQGDRIKARGLGEGQPVADNGSAEGRANNRRVEIIIENESQASNR